MIRKADCKPSPTSCRVPAGHHEIHARTVPDRPAAGSAARVHRRNIARFAEPGAPGAPGMPGAPGAPLLADRRLPHGGRRRHGLATADAR